MHDAMNKTSRFTVPVLYRLRHRLTKEWHPNGALYAPAAIEHGRKRANMRTWHESNHDISNAWEGVPGCNECGHHVMGFAKGEYNGYCRSCTLKATKLQAETSRALPVDFGSPEMIAQVVPEGATNPVFDAGPAIQIHHVTGRPVPSSYELEAKLRASIAREEARREQWESSPVVTVEKETL